MVKDSGQEYDIMNISFFSGAMLFGYSLCIAATNIPTKFENIDREKSLGLILLNSVADIRNEVYIPPQTSEIITEVIQENLLLIFSLTSFGLLAPFLPYFIHNSD